MFSLKSEDRKQSCTALMVHDEAEDQSSAEPLVLLFSVSMCLRVISVFLNFYVYAALNYQYKQNVLDFVCQLSSASSIETACDAPHSGATCPSLPSSILTGPSSTQKCHSRIAPGVMLLVLTGSFPGKRCGRNTHWGKQEVLDRLFVELFIVMSQYPH